MVYERILRPLLFTLPADVIHPVVAHGGEFAAHIPGISFLLEKIYRVHDQRLSQTIGGIHFDLPVGLSAGFDKNASYIPFAHLFGFGFTEVGSVTGEPYAGNTGPHARRLVHSRSMVINYGLASQGVEKVAQKLARVHRKIPVGVSVAKTNLPAFTGDAAVEDYVRVFNRLYSLADYLTINISCPNTFDGTPFTDPEKCNRLLSRIASARTSKKEHKMIFIKINPDIPRVQLDVIITLAITYGVDGFVIGNLLKDATAYRSRLSFPDEYNPAWPGGLSGEPTRTLATDCIKYVFKKTEGKKIIIGSGGIFSGDDAYEKICAGASLCQLITGFIFQGPKLLANIHHRLLVLLERDGYTSITQAIGSNV